MKKAVIVFLCVLFFSVPVSAEEIIAPVVPDTAQEYMPVDTGDFGEALLYVIKSAVQVIQPELTAAGRVCLSMICGVLLVSILKGLPGKQIRVTEFVGTLAISALMLHQTNSLVRLGTETVTKLSEYGKLLLPVMTAALASQGGTTSSAALYAGTAVFDAVLCSAISKILIPMVYLYLALSIANSAAGEEALKKLRDLMKWLMTWILKIILYVFTGYMAITGVISGSADAAAVKAAKLTISGMIPVVGSILSDASEAVLVGAEVMKNTVGVYGVLAILAVWLAPFLQIGVHYLLLKATAAVCGVFGVQHMSELISDFSGAMGFLLAMTGAVCFLLLISTVCFMKGVG